MGLPTTEQAQLYNQLVSNTQTLKLIGLQDSFEPLTVAQTDNANLYLASVGQVDLNVTKTNQNVLITQANVNTTNHNVTFTQQHVASALAAKLAAESARDAAVLSTAVYASTQLGIANTTTGTYFSVPSQDSKEYLRLYYRDTANTAQLVQTYPSVAALEYSLANTIYVAASGSNTNNGGSWKNAFRTIEYALEVARNINAPMLIEWAPESIVYTKGHLDVPDNCVIKAVHRTVFIRPVPGYEQRNVFRLGSGCFLEGVMFEGWQLDSLTNPSEGFAVSFRPGAVITRVPYAHKIAARTLPSWGIVAPPLDVNMGNPLVPIAGGVCLADGAVCSQYSIFPNIMTWGATPVLPNGIGYCAKNGGLINAVNAVSMWAHKHFLALNGGQIILSACSTQFGDYSLAADGTRNIVNPQIAYISTNITNKPPVINTGSDLAVLQKFIDGSTIDTITGRMYAEMVAAGYTANWTYSVEAKTKSDARLLLQCLYWSMTTGNEKPMLDFAKGMFDVLAKPAYISPARLASYIPETVASPETNICVQQIKSNETQIANYTWNRLIELGYVQTASNPLAALNTGTDQTLTKRDTKTLLVALENTLLYAREEYMWDFVRGLHNTDGTLVISASKLPATIASFGIIRDQVLNLPTVVANTTVKNLVNNLFTALISNFTFKTFTPTSSISSTAAKQTIIDETWSQIVVKYGTVVLGNNNGTSAKIIIGDCFDKMVASINNKNDTTLRQLAQTLRDTYIVGKTYSEDILAIIYLFTALKTAMIKRYTTTANLTDIEKLTANLISNFTLNSNKYAFIFCWNYVKKYITTDDPLIGIGPTSALYKETANIYLAQLLLNINQPKTIKEPSRITAIGHTWTAVMAGVALTKVPPANNNAKIQDSIIESADGVVIASGQDDQGNALFVGGLEISADTGELGGSPFDQAVRRVATKTSISRSF